METHRTRSHTPKPDSDTSLGEVVAGLMRRRLGLFLGNCGRTKVLSAIAAADERGLRSSRVLVAA